MKLILLSFFQFLFLCLVHAQTSLAPFNNERAELEKNGMIILGSWGAANLAAGAAGMVWTHGESHYFYQMNLIWGAVNLGIALPGFLSARHSVAEESLAETVKNQSTVEKIFLFNTGLDLAYLFAGAYCLAKSDQDSRRDLYEGYGKSLFMQGGGLLAFDVTLSLLHLHHSKKLYKALGGLQVSGNRIGMTWTW